MIAARLLDWVAVLDVASLLFMGTAVMASIDRRWEASGLATVVAALAAGLSTLLAVGGALFT